MERRSAQDITEKQVRRLSESIPDVQAGINAVDVSPTAQAAEHLDKAQQNYVAAITSGRMAKNLRAVTLADWKESTLAKVDRIAPGAEASRGKIERFHAQRQDHQKRIDSELVKMPTRTKENMYARALHQMRRMSEFAFDKTR
jgi:hypothetical protein